MKAEQASAVRIIAALLLALASTVRAEAPAVSLPRTPAARVLSEWLAAFNSDDRTRLESFRQKYSWGVSAEGALQWQAGVGGYGLIEVDKDDKTLILFRVRVRADGSEEFGRIRLASIDPPVIAQLSSHRIPTGAR